MAMTVHAFWDTDQIANTLNAVVNIMGGGGDYTGLLKAVAIVGLFVAVGTGFARARGEDAGVYFIMLLIWYGGLFLPKTDVIVQDANRVGHVRTVSNVPIGLALFASTTSHIGYWLTKTYETFLSVPTDLKFQTNGFLFGARILEARQNARVIDPALYRDYIQFMKNCIVDEIADNGPALRALADSTDIWATMGPMMNQGRLVMLYDAGSGQIRGYDCLEGYNTNMTPRLNAEVATVQAKLHAFMNWQNPSASVVTQLESSDSVLLGISQGAAQGLRQAIMINILRDTPKNIAVITDNTAAAQVAAAEAIAAAQANTSYRVMAKIGESTLPAIRGALNVVLIAVFPVILLLVILAGAKGGVVLMGYLQTMIWIQLWAPLYAVANHLYTGISTGNAASLIASTSPGGVSFSTADALTGSLVSGQAIAGLLSLAVPAMALALVKGGAVALSGVASSLTSPASSAAQSAGAQAGMGNLQAGQTQWGNVQMYTHSANNRTEGQWNTAWTNTHGAATDIQRLPGGSTVTTWAGSGAPGVLNRSGGVSNLGDLGLNLGSGVSTAAREQSQRMAQSAAHFASSSATSLQTGLQRIKDFASRSSSGVNTGRGYGADLTGSVVNAASRVQQAARDLAAKTGLTDKQAFELMAYAEARVATPSVMGSQLAAGLRAQGKSSSEITSAYESAQKLVSSDSYKDDKQMVYGYAHRVNTEAFAGNERSAVNGIKASLTQAQSAETTAGKEMRLAESYSTVAERAASGQWGAGLDPANEYVHNWRRGPGEANDFLSTATPEQKLADAQLFVNRLADRMAQAGLTNFQDGSGRNAGLEKEVTTATGAPPTTGQDIDKRDAENRGVVQGQFDRDKQKVPGKPGGSGAPDARSVHGVAQEGIRRTQDAVTKGRQVVVDTGRPLADATSASLEGGQKPLGVAVRGVANVNPLSPFNGFKGNLANPANRDKNK